MTTLDEIARGFDVMLREVRAMRNDLQAINSTLVRVCVTIDDVQRLIGEIKRDAPTDS